MLNLAANQLQLAQAGSSTYKCDKRLHLEIFKTQVFSVPLLQNWILGTLQYVL